jgi:hypothetical protein
MDDTVWIPALASTRLTALPRFATESGVSATLRELQEYSGRVLIKAQMSAFRG